MSISVLRFMSISKVFIAWLVKGDLTVSKQLAVSIQLVKDESAFDKLVATRYLILNKRSGRYRLNIHAPGVVALVASVHRSITNDTDEWNTPVPNRGRKYKKKHTTVRNRRIVDDSDTVNKKSFQDVFDEQQARAVEFLLVTNKTCSVEEVLDYLNSTLPLKRRAKYRVVEAMLHQHDQSVCLVDGRWTVLSNIDAECSFDYEGKENKQRMDIGKHATQSYIDGVVRENRFNAVTKQALGFIEQHPDGVDFESVMKHVGFKPHAHKYLYAVLTQCHDCWCRPESDVWVATCDD